MFEGLRKNRRVIGHWVMELLVVFTGVLIALGAQGWANERSSRARAKAAEVRIRNELELGVQLGIERIALRQCLKQRLANIAEGLSSGRTDWSSMRIADQHQPNLFAFGPLYRMPSRNWVSSEYRSSAANGALDTLSPERNADLANIYEAIESQGEFNAEEQQLATRLAAIQFGTPLSALERNDLLATVTRLDYLNGLMVLVAKQSAEAYQGLYTFTPEELDEMRNGWSAHVPDVEAVYGNCVDAQAIGEIDRRLLN